MTSTSKYEETVDGFGKFKFYGQKNDRKIKRTAKYLQKIGNSKLFEEKIHFFGLKSSKGKKFSKQTAMWKQI